MTESLAHEIDFEIHPSQTPVPAAERARILEAPGFGQVFTDHMITLRWTAERGWHDGKLEPYGPFTLDPATAVFHYGQELFEGLKAYRQASGSIVMFRPRSNAARFNSSCRRMAMPELPEDAFVRALELLVTQDRDWVPEGEGKSLYLRPFVIATQRGLGVNHPSTEYLFCVIASPAASYFGEGKTVKVWMSEDYTRAAPGGTGLGTSGFAADAATLSPTQLAERQKAESQRSGGTGDRRSGGRPGNCSAPRKATSSSLGRRSMSARSRCGPSSISYTLFAARA